MNKSKYLDKSVFGFYIFQPMLYKMILYLSPTLSLLAGLKIEITCNGIPASFCENGVNNHSLKEKTLTNQAKISKLSTLLTISKHIIYLYQKISFHKIIGSSSLVLILNLFHLFPVQFIFQNVF